MSIKSNEKFWYDDIKVIFDKDKLLKIPSKNNTIEENLNSIIRLVIYTSIILSCYSLNINYLILIIVAFIATYFIYREHYRKIIENYDTNITKITHQNPVNNVLQQDYKDDNEKIMDLLEDKKLQNRIKKALDHKLYRDESDIFDNQHSQRTFYTMPVTTIPNKQKDFANFLYQTPKTCKEGNGARCFGNIHNPPQIWGRGDLSPKLIITKQSN